MDRIRLLPAREFYEFGYLQEANRRFFHPLGLSIAVQETDEGIEYVGIVDYRDEELPLTLAISEEEVEEALNAKERIDNEIVKRADARMDVFGNIQEPIEYDRKVQID
jgi:hypothetical protein